MSEVVLAKAAARGVAQTPRKVGLVASLVRGRTVADALVILEHTPRRAAKPISKVIASAAANATNTFGAKNDGLVIESLQVTSGPRMKRGRAGARGMYKPYQKRTSHIFVVVSGEKKPKKQPVKKEAKKEAK